MRNIFRIVCGFLFICLLCANNAAMGDSELPIPDINYQFRLGKEEKAHLLEGLGKVKLGDSLDYIKSSLGDPTQEKDLVDKKGKFISHVLEYYIARVDARFVNIHDIVIRLYFNESKRLIKVNAPRKNAR